MRLTPGGMLFVYEANGRLKRIFHRYRTNNIELTYSPRGELRRIEDRSTGERRYIQLSYYRKAGPELTSLDDETMRDADVSRIRDHLGSMIPRDVLYHYDEHGRLEGIEGVEVRTVTASGVTGRRQTTY